MLSNSEIKWLLEQLEKIPHVEIKRFGTRTPVTLPFRLTISFAKFYPATYRSISIHSSIILLK